MENENDTSGIKLDHDDDDSEQPAVRGWRPSVLLIIVIFIAAENLIIPPRYQVSNNIVLGLIWVYQETASKAFKSSGMVKCRFYPTCSEYGRLVLLHDGFIVGSARAAYRVLRCNPFNHGPHEDWPYEGAWIETKQLPQPYLHLDKVEHLPPWTEGFEDTEEERVDVKEVGF